jgi:zinc transport system ATP-binding protein
MLLSQGISFSVLPGDLLLIRGKNGVGKTTLLKTIVDLNSHHAGSIKRNFDYSEISYLPQVGNIQFFVPLTLLDVVQLKQKKDVRNACLKLSLLSPESLDLEWNTASGGERQKAILSQIFLSDSKLFILDEPFNHLDAQTKNRVKEIIELKREQKSAVIMVSHDEFEFGYKAVEHFL